MSPNDTRLRLIETACNLMHGRSYADVGVAAICQQAGVQKGSFYHFFDSKQTLTLAAIEAYAGEVGALFDQALARDLPPLARLDRLVEAIAERQAADHRRTGRILGCPFGNLASEMSTQDEVLRRRLEQVLGGLRSGLGELLREAVAGGELPTLDPEASAAAMLAYLEGMLLLAKTANDPGLIRRLGPALKDIHID